MERVTDLLERHREALERTSRALLDKETLEEREILKLTPEIERTEGSGMPGREETRGAAE